MPKPLISLYKLDVLTIWISKVSVPLSLIKQIVLTKKLNHLLIVKSDNSSHNNLIKYFQRTQIFNIHSGFSQKRTLAKIAILVSKAFPP